LTDFSNPSGFPNEFSIPCRPPGTTEPTPIQQAAIPAVLEGHDIMGLAQTGTGKTAAFGLPLIDKLLADPPTALSQKLPRADPRADARTGQPDHRQSAQLREARQAARSRPSLAASRSTFRSATSPSGKDILVATPGRLIDLMERKAVILAQTHFLVLDEADQMLDLGFIHSLRQIAKALPKERQTLLFSATMPKEIESLSKTYLTDPVRVEVSPPARPPTRSTSRCISSRSAPRPIFSRSILAEREGDLSLVFARTKHGAEKLMKHLVANGFSAASIHGNKSQGQRDRAIRDFRSGSTRILVATDVAARGIDIPGVSHVYNYDLPQVPESYVHRIGRTARAGAEGRAVSFCAEDEAKMLRDIEKLTGVSITVASGEHPGFGAGGRKDGRGGRGRGGGNRGGGAPQGEKREARSSDNQNRKRPHRGKRPQGEQGTAQGEAGAGAPSSRPSSRPKWRRNRKSRAA
jgi:ATP-dependent RNA helicase RhlE